MATTHRTTVRTDDDHLDPRGALLLAAYGASLLGVVSVATGAAVVLGGLTDGLGGFVLVAGAWLAVVSASPALAKRFTVRLGEVELAERAPRSSRAVRAAVAFLVAK